LGYADVAALAAVLVEGAAAVAAVAAVVAVVVIAEAETVAPDLIRTVESSRSAVVRVE
jgi:hypothetical protein